MIVNYTTWKKLNESANSSNKPEMRVESDGSERWYLNGKLHREDGPAVILANGTKGWYLNGELHREDGPAIERTYGTKEWYLNGKLHRGDGPAVEWMSGTKTKEWYLNDKRHREDGPAVEFTDGKKEWWLNGRQLSYEKFSEITLNVEGIVPDDTYIKLILGIKNGDPNAVISKLNNVFKTKPATFVKLAKATVAVFGIGNRDVNSILMSNLKNKFSESEIDNIFSYYYKNLFELEGLSDMFSHRNDADW
jgi:hypothetical protein